LNQQKNQQTIERSTNTGFTKKGYGKER